MPSLKTHSLCCVTFKQKIFLVHAGVEAVGLPDERDVAQDPLVLGEGIRLAQANQQPGPGYIPYLLQDPQDVEDEDSMATQA